MTDSEKKIIVDEDWKAQVERERAEATDSDSNPSASGDTGAGETGAEETGADESEMDFDPSQLPPPSFSMLITSLATQAMAAMGAVPDPMTGKAEINLPFAKYHIDLLAVLQQKTTGNLDEEEAGMMEGAVHQLRMMYVEMEQSSS